MGANKKTFLLHSGNIIVIIKEWHYGDFYPQTYYYYKANLTTEVYSKVFEGKKFVHYEMVSKRISTRVDE
jgi:hypothetical protein